MIVPEIDKIKGFMLALFQTAVIVGDFAAILEVNICEERDCTPLS